MNTSFRGVYTALITPFLQNGAIDYRALEILVEDQISAGIDGLVILGTTGESPTITHRERNELVRFIVRIVGGRIKIIVGTGCNDTVKTLHYSHDAASAGVDALLLVNPYYNKPPQEGLYRHFKAVADTVDIPQILYNIQGRTGVNLETTTLRKLVMHPNIVGVKEASGNLSQMMEVIETTPDDFLVFSGDDCLTYPLLCLGGHGVISVVSHLAPRRMRELVSAGLNGDYETARKIHFDLLPLMRGCFLETNPIPVKTALALQGKIQNVFRLPLCTMSEEARARWEEILRNYHLIDTGERFLHSHQSLACTA